MTNKINENQIYFTKQFLYDSVDALNYNCFANITTKFFKECKYLIHLPVPSLHRVYDEYEDKEYIVGIKLEWKHFIKYSCKKTKNPDYIKPSKRKNSTIKFKRHASFK